MNQSGYLIDVLIFLAAMVIIVPIFQRFKLSPILGYLAGGMLIGPYGFALIGETSAAQTLAHFGVVFLLFMIGLELSFRRLRTLGGKVFGLGSMQVLISGSIIGLIAYIFGLGAYTSAIIGGGLALSSTAFVLQLLEERRERATRFGLTTFSILLLQDLAVVPLLVFVTLVGTPGASFLETLGLAAMNGGAALIIVLVFGRLFLRPVYKMIANTRSTELFVSTTLLTVLGMAWIMSSAGLSLELGALLAGLLLAETEYRHQIEADIKPFRGILLGLFFMTIGMSINIGFIVANIGLITVLVIGLMLGKTIITTFLCRIIGTPISTSVQTGLALSQGGEFGFVIFGAALVLGLITQNVSQILMAVIALSMVATPAMFFIGRYLADQLKKRSDTQPDSFDESIADVKNHVLIAGFGRVGQTVANVLSDAGISYVALDLDQKRVSKCRDKGMPVYFGDADRLHVLQAVGVGRAQMVVITIDHAKNTSRIVSALRVQYPDLPIYVRARDQQHVRSLEKMGATEVVSEAAESSLQLGSEVLKSFGLSIDEITSLIQTYREDDYEKLEEIISGK
ncbi:MAG: cation:proton antiporter [Robiginitomaculum sp.]|nr:cation:proton antiporter [Robiginitomaculum sp.]